MVLLVATTAYSIDIEHFLDSIYVHAENETDIVNNEEETTAAAGSVNNEKCDGNAKDSEDCNKIITNSEKCDSLTTILLSFGNIKCS